MILPQAILDTPKLGCFNLHASLLPRWRGAAPINRAIMAGDGETGVMVMKMDAGLDTGDVAMAERMAITDAMTAADVHDALARLGGDLMARAMGALERGKLQLTRQSNEGVTYATKIEKVETRIDWNKPAREVLRHIHGLSPFPGAWCEMPIEGQNARVKILRCAMADGSGAPGEVLDGHLTVACSEGAIRILELQRAGKQPMKAEDFLRGAPEDAVWAICGEPVRVYGAGRTDAGVHALAQVAHCDIAKHFVPGRLRDGLNAHLRPHPIGVLSAEIVPDSFDARFSAKRRHYLYRIANRRANLALDIGRAWRLPRPLDTDAMHAAAQKLIGKHDFTTFRDSECQARSPEKTFDQLDVVRDGDAVNIATSARSFLHSQVRSMVGSLVWVGEGRWSADDLAAALAARHGAPCGPVAR